MNHKTEVEEAETVHQTAENEEDDENPNLQFQFKRDIQNMKRNYFFYDQQLKLANENRLALL